MGGMFKAKTPKAPDPLPPPAQPDEAAASDAEAERARRRRGRASTELAGQSSVQPQNVAVKQLLGQ